MVTLLLSRRPIAMVFKAAAAAAAAAVTAPLCIRYLNCYVHILRVSLCNAQDVLQQCNTISNVCLTDVLRALQERLEGISRIDKGLLLVMLVCY